MYEAFLQIFPTLWSLPLFYLRPYLLYTNKLTDCDSKSYVKAKPTNLLYSQNFNGQDPVFAEIISPCVPNSIIEITIQKRSGVKTTVSTPVNFGPDCDVKPTKDFWVFSVKQPGGGKLIINYKAQLAEAGTYEVSFTNSVGRILLLPPCRSATVTLKS